MFDFVLGIGLAGLLVRGWLRGFVREVLDLVSLVLGVWVAFALSGPLGNFLSDRFDVNPEVARIGSGILLFVLFGVAMSIAAHFLSTVMRLPGLNLVNRIGGALVAISWGVVLVLVAVNIVGALPGADDWEATLDESAVVGTIAGDNAIPQRLFSGVAKSGALAALSNLQSTFGQSRVVPQGNEVLNIPPAKGDELRQVRDEVDLILDRINERRTSDVVGALLSTMTMTSVAEDRGVKMYKKGRISRDTPEGGSVLDDLEEAGVRLEVAGEALALAATGRAAIDALFEDSEASALLLSADFDRVGVALVDGPTGVLLVVVLGG